MTENEVLFEISGIVNGKVTFHQAVEQISLLLEREASAARLIFDDAEGAAALLDSLDKPYRPMYSVELREGGETLGKITLCFASDRPLGAFPQRVADFAGEQLGMLLRRTQLAQRRAQLKCEIASIEEDLATRKLMQRVEGLLLVHRRLKAGAARRWIEQQSQKTGLSVNDVAGRVIAYYQATGLLEQKIA